MGSGMFRKLLSLLLTGTLAAACPAFAAGTVQLGSVTAAALSSAVSGKVYVANTEAALPSGKYFLCNVGSGTVMPNTIDSRNHSFEAKKVGYFGDVVYETSVPEAYLYTVTDRGNGYYTIQNSSGQYLDIVAYGRFAFTGNYTTLKFTPTNLGEPMSFNISKQVGDSEQSIAMWSDEWYTPHGKNLGAADQCISFYRVEESADVLNTIDRIDNLFPDNDPSLISLSSGVTRSELQTLLTKVQSCQLPARYRYLVERAIAVLDGGSSIPYTSFKPLRSGKNADYAQKLHLAMFYSDRMPTGIWGSPGDVLHIYVKAAENDPLPQIMFTQHVSNSHEERIVALRRGMNVITVPKLHENFSDYKIPTVEPGGLIYLLNPYTKQEQSANVEVSIEGGDIVPTFSYSDDTESFLAKLRDYNTHYQNKEAGYHNVCELNTKYSYITLTMERALEAYVTEGLDPHDTMQDWDDFIEHLMAHDGIKKEEYENLRLGVKVNQPYAGAYATSEMICIQDNEWLASFIAGRYGWGFPHEVGHALDNDRRCYVELTNNMWSIEYALSHNMYDSLAVRKVKPKYDLKLIAPPDMNSYWSPENSRDTTYWWCLYMLWDLEVYHRGYWGELDTMFRNGSCGSSTIDAYLENCTLNEKIAAYSSKILGTDLTYYFNKYGYLTNESTNYKNAIAGMSLSTKQPKFYYYKTDSYNYPIGSNIGKGNIEVSAYNPNTKSMYFSVPTACAGNHLGFEIVKNGKVIDFTWEYQYTDSSADGTYTINAYDTALNLYSSTTFSVNDSAYTNKYTARVNGTYYKSLSEAINAASSGDTVYLLGSTYLDSPVTLNKAVTIMPESNAKQVLICNRVTNSSAFVINAGGSLTITAPSGSPDHTVIFDNAYSYQNDEDMVITPCFAVNGGSLTFGKGVTIQHCANYYAGAVISAKSASVNLNGCILRHNRSNKEGMIYIAEGSVLRSTGGTKICFNRASTGSAIYSASADNQIYLSDTEINDNFCTEKGASTVSVSTGSIDVGSGTSIHGNADAYFSVNSAMFIGSGASANFSGKLNITDKVTLCTSARVDPAGTGTLNLRADRTVVKSGFVLALPTNGTFPQSITKTVQYENSLYVLAYQTDRLTVGNYQPPQVSFTASSSSIPLGQSDTLTCSVTGGKAPYQYRMEMKKSTDTSYTVLKAYNSTASCTWKPSAAGTYNLRATVKDAKGKTSSKTITVKVSTPDVRNTSTISAASIKLGQSVTVTCSGSAGVTPYTYAVAYKKSAETSYTIAMKYGTNNTAVIKPTAVGTYTVTARVKDKNGMVTAKNFTLTVSAGDLANKSTVSAADITLGSTVTIKCSASGGTSPYTYAVFYQETGTESYQKLRAYSSDTSVSFKPAAAKKYTLRVRVKDQNGTTADKHFTVNVEKPVTFKAALSATAITLGETVKVTCSVTGTATMQYAVYYKKSTQNTWTTAKDYSTANTASVKPKYAGTYQIAAKAKDSTGKVTRKDFTVKVNAALKNTSAISPAAISLGSTLKVTCASTGGTGTKQYAVYYKRSGAGTWTKAKGYSTGTSAAVTPKYAAAYTIRTMVRDSRNNVTKKDFTVKVAKTFRNTSYVSAATITRGGSVKVTCASTGGVGTAKYAVYYKKTSQKKWTKAKGYSTTKTVSVTPKYAGNYTVRVKAIDANGSIVKKDFAVHVNAALTNSSAISASTILLGKSVTVNCASKGGTGTKKYAVFYKRKTVTEWAKAQSYSTNKTVSVTPKYAAEYTVRVKVKDAAGKVTNKDLTLTVTKALKNTSKVSASTIKRGQTVTVTCASTGGTGTKQYAVFYKQKDASGWIKARAYGTGTTVKITPKSAAVYVIRVKAKDTAGKIVNKDLLLTVQSANTLKNSSTVSTTSISAGSSVKLTLKAEKGTAPYYFRIEKMKAGDTSWIVVKDYSSITSASVRLPSKGTYQIRVTVMDMTGAAATKYFTVSAL